MERRTLIDVELVIYSSEDRHRQHHHDNFQEYIVLDEYLIVAPYYLGKYIPKPLVSTISFALIKLALVL